MKKILYILILLCMILSCGDSNTSTTTDNSTATPDTPDTAKIVNATRVDSILREDSIKIDLLTNVCDSMKNESKAKDKKIASLEKWSYVNIVSLLLSAIALVVAIVKIWKKEETINKQELINEVTERVTNALKNSSTQGTKPEANGTTGSKGHGLIKRDDYLNKNKKNKKEASQQESETHTSVSKKPEEHQETPQEPPKKVTITEYANSTSGENLVDCSETKTEKSAFKIEYEEDYYGRWEFIGDINMYKSMDGINKVMDSSGSLDKATSYSVKKKGKCRKNGEMWNIINKIEVNFS